jgi:hypothetical protein
MLAGLTVAEYFRDVEGQDVLLFVDNIFRFTQARIAAAVLGVMHLTNDREINAFTWMLLYNHYTGKL